jgi:site-specific DNA-methyltransferase (adenine-specific)
MTVSILTGDCREVMATLPEASVDAIIADPPYQQTSLPWDRWPSDWPAAARRVLKPTGSMWVFGSLRMFTQRWSEFYGWNMAQDIVWEKHNGSSFHADRFRRVHEQAVQFYKRDAAWSDVYKGKVVTNDAKARVVRKKAGKQQHMGALARDSVYVSEDGGPRIARSVIYVRSEHGRAVHPTQKPIGIIEPLIESACPPGGTVLDPFFGSGTTGAAALMLGRSCIGIEAREDYVAAAQDRLNAELGMFARAAE